VSVQELAKEYIMYRWITSTIVAILFSAIAQTPQFSIRAASSEPVAGWDRMQLDDRVVWVSPTASLTAADIAKAEPTAKPDGKKAIGVEFTDAGADKMRRLSAAQIDKLIAMVLDGKLIWAPRVRSEIGKQGMITGNGPNGLDDETIQRILSSVKR
jgi:preprotein translocase subunit SecD